LAVVVHIPRDLAAQFAGLNGFTLNKVQVVRDFTTGRRDHPLEIFAVILAILIQVEVTDQGKLLRIGRIPAGRVK